MVAWMVERMAVCSVGLWANPMVALLADSKAES